ncbi:hypothetical protein ADUPG1_006708, partial [Aduncisulcus paluster]
CSSPLSSESSTSTLSVSTGSEEYISSTSLVHSSFPLASLLFSCSSSLPLISYSPFSYFSTSVFMRNCFVFYYLGRILISEDLKIDNWMHALNSHLIAISSSNSIIQLGIEAISDEYMNIFSKSVSQYGVLMSQIFDQWVQREKEREKKKNEIEPEIIATSSISSSNMVPTFERTTNSKPISSSPSLISLLPSSLSNSSLLFANLILIQRELWNIDDYSLDQDSEMTSILLSISSICLFASSISPCCNRLLQQKFVTKFQNCHFLIGEFEEAISISLTKLKKLNSSSCRRKTLLKILKGKNGSNENELREKFRISSQCARTSMYQNIDMTTKWFLFDYINNIFHPDVNSSQAMGEGKEKESSLFSSIFLRSKRKEAMIEEKEWKDRSKILDTSVATIAKMCQWFLDICVWLCTIEEAEWKKEIQKKKADKFCPLSTLFSLLSSTVPRAISSTFLFISGFLRSLRALLKASFIGVTGGSKDIQTSVLSEILCCCDISIIVREVYVSCCIWVLMWIQRRRERIVIEKELEIALLEESFSLSENDVFESLIENITLWLCGPATTQLSIFRDPSKKKRDIEQKKHKYSSVSSMPFFDPFSSVCIDRIFISALLYFLLPMCIDRIHPSSKIQSSSVAMSLVMVIVSQVPSLFNSPISQKSFDQYEISELDLVKQFVDNCCGQCCLNFLSPKSASTPIYPLPPSTISANSDTLSRILDNSDLEMKDWLEVEWKYSFKTDIPSGTRREKEGETISQSEKEPKEGDVCLDDDSPSFFALSLSNSYLSLCTVVNRMHLNAKCLAMLCSDLESKINVIRMGEDEAKPLSDLQTIISSTIPPISAIPIIIKMTKHPQISSHSLYSQHLERFFSSNLFLSKSSAILSSSLHPNLYSLSPACLSSSQGFLQRNILRFFSSNLFLSKSSAILSSSLHPNLYSLSPACLSSSQGFLQRNILVPMFTEGYYQSLISKSNGESSIISTLTKRTTDSKAPISDSRLSLSLHLSSFLSLSSISSLNIPKSGMFVKNFGSEWIKSGTKCPKAEKQASSYFALLYSWIRRRRRRGEEENENILPIVDQSYELDSDSFSSLIEIDIEELSRAFNMNVGVYERTNTILKFDSDFEAGDNCMSSFCYLYPCFNAWSCSLFPNASHQLVQYKDSSSQTSELSKHVLFPRVKRYKSIPLLSLFSVKPLLVCEMALSTDLLSPMICVCVMSDVGFWILPGVAIEKRTGKDFEVNSNSDENISNWKKKKYEFSLDGHLSNENRESSFLGELLESLCLCPSPQIPSKDSELSDIQRVLSYDQEYEDLFLVNLCQDRVMLERATRETDQQTLIPPDPPCIPRFYPYDALISLRNTVHGLRRVGVSVERQDIQEVHLDLMGFGDETNISMDKDNNNYIPPHPALSVCDSFVFIDELNSSNTWSYPEGVAERACMLFCLICRQNMTIRHNTDSFLSIIQKKEVFSPLPSLSLLSISPTIVSPILQYISVISGRQDHLPVPGTVSMATLYIGRAFQILGHDLSHPIFEKITDNMGTNEEFFTHCSQISPSSSFSKFIPSLVVRIWSDIFVLATQRWKGENRGRKRSKKFPFLSSSSDSTGVKMTVQTSSKSNLFFSSSKMTYSQLLYDILTVPFPLHVELDRHALHFAVLPPGEQLKDSQFNVKALNSHFLDLLSLWSDWSINHAKHGKPRIFKESSTSFNQIFSSHLLPTSPYSNPKSIIEADIHGSDVSDSILSSSSSLASSQDSSISSSQCIPRSNPHPCIQFLLRPLELLYSTAMISSLSYLTSLSFLAQRWVCELSQYPSIPWVWGGYGSCPNSRDDKIYIGKDWYVNNQAHRFQDSSSYEKDGQGVSELPSFHSPSSDSSFASKSVTSVNSTLHTPKPTSLDSVTPFRSLSMPMGMLSDKRMKSLIDRSVVSVHSVLTPNIPHVPFLYSSHCSNSAIVLFYNLRTYPFLEQHICLQSGQFDKADRVFKSIFTAWNGASRDNVADVKEMVIDNVSSPSIYSNSSMLLNIGTCTDFRTGDSLRTVWDVILPRWSHNNPYLMCRLMRILLESPPVSKRLHHWVELMYGKAQRGIDSIRRNNVFHPVGYIDTHMFWNIPSMKPRSDASRQANLFGVIPSQLEDSVSSLPRKVMYPAESLQNILENNCGMIAPIDKNRREKVWRSRENVWCEWNNSVIVVISGKEVSFIHDRYESVKSASETFEANPKFNIISLFHLPFSSVATSLHITSYCGNTILFVGFVDGSISIFQLNFTKKRSRSKHIYYDCIGHLRRIIEVKLDDDSCSDEIFSLSSIHASLPLMFGSVTKIVSTECGIVWFASEFGYLSACKLNGFHGLNSSRFISFIGSFSAGLTNPVALCDIHSTDCIIVSQSKLKMFSLTCDVGQKIVMEGDLLQNIDDSSILATCACVLSAPDWFETGVIVVGYNNGEIRFFSIHFIGDIIEIGSDSFQRKNPGQENIHEKDVCISPSLSVPLSTESSTKTSVEEILTPRGDASQKEQWRGKLKLIKVIQLHESSIVDIRQYRSDSDIIFAIDESGYDIQFKIPKREPLTEKEPKESKRCEVCGIHKASSQCVGCLNWICKECQKEVDSSYICEVGIHHIMCNDCLSKYQKSFFAANMGL